MQALAQALMAELSEFKVAIFETLAAAARWPSLKGQVAGSGVLGVVSALLLAPRHPPPVKALMVRLCAALTVDSPECVQLGDVKRAEEFSKLRGQLLSSGAVEAIVGMIGPRSCPLLTSAAADALATFAGVGSDAAMRAALAKASAAAKLLACLPGSTQESACPAEGVDSTEARAHEGVDVVDSAPKESSSEAAAASSGGNEADEEPDEDEDYNLTQVLAALARLAAAEGDGAEEVLRPLREPGVPARLRALAGQGEGGAAQEVRERGLACLAVLGMRLAAWPTVDEGLSADLARLITCGSEHAQQFLVALLGDRARAVQLGDLRPLRRAARARRAGELCKVLDALPGCEHCGKASEKSMLVCTGCRQVEYCSRDCQKAAWNC